MAVALGLAQSGGTECGWAPIGCVVVLEGKVVAEGCNEIGLRHDPTTHAEIVTIRRACVSLDRDELQGATLYSTLQPCGICTMASIWAGIGRLVYGAGQEDVHRMYFETHNPDSINFVADTHREDLEVVAGVRREEAARLYSGPRDDLPSDGTGNA